MLKLLFWMLPGAAVATAAYTPPLENQGRVPDASEAAAILKAVCGDGAQVKDSPQGAQMYCNPCPDFTSLHGITTERFEVRWVALLETLYLPMGLSIHFMPVIQAVLPPFQASNALLLRYCGLNRLFTTP